MTPAFARRLAMAAAALAWVAWPGPSGATADNRGGRLLAETGGSSFCFERVYDRAHLRRNPRQQTLGMLASLAAGKDRSGRTLWVRLRLQLMARTSPADIAASCAWEAKANRDTSGQPLIAGYPREDGFACVALYGNQAAEEAGALMLDIAADGRTVMVYLDDSTGLWGTSPEHAAPGGKGRWTHVSGDAPLRLGRDDRVFRLQRTDAAACSDMERAIDLAID